MIQRIQTLFLLVVLLSGIACFFSPFWIYTGSNYTCYVNMFGAKQVMGAATFQIISTMPVIVVLSISLILTIVSIFYFKNRRVQLKINGYNLLLTVIFIGTIYLWIPYIITDKLPDASYDWQYGLIFPLISLVFILLAGRFIKKDEKLVKSADRLR